MSKRTRATAGGRERTGLRIDPPRPVLRGIRETIVELDDAPDGMRWTTLSDGARHATASAALAHIAGASARRVRAGGPSEVLAIDWTPRTRVGRIVARAIASAHEGGE